MQHIQLQGTALGGTKQRPSKRMRSLFLVVNGSYPVRFNSV